MGISSSHVRGLLFLIIGWYVLSIGLMMYNKWMFDPEKGLGISLPVGLTGCHQVVLWIASSIYLRYKKKTGGQELNEALTSEQIKEHKSNRSHQFWRYILPTAIFSAGDIGFGNMSLRYIPLTVHIIIKSSSIIFVLLFSCLFKIEKFNWRLFGIVIVMATGVCMMVYKPVESSPDTDITESNKARARFFFGCMLVLLSSCLSGLRWVYTQLILRNQTHRKSSTAELSASHTALREVSGSIENNTNIIDEGKDLESGSLKKHVDGSGLPPPDAPAPGTRKNNPIRTINSLSPIMAIALFITSLLLEHPLAKFRDINMSLGMIVARIFGLMVLPGCCVLAFTWCEFTILRVTKVLTLSIAGIVKEVLTIILSMIILKERLYGILNWIGMVTILVDVMYYNFFRYQQSSGHGDYHPVNGEETRVEAEEDIASTSGSASGSATGADNDIPMYSISTDNTCQEYQINKALDV